MFERAGTLYAMPFDVENLRALGPSVPVLDGVRKEADSGAAQFAVSADGTLAYVRGEVMEEASLMWVPRDAPLEPTPAWPGTEVYGQPQLSPDGTKIAVTVKSEISYVWVFDLDRGPRIATVSFGD